VLKDKSLADLYNLPIPDVLVNHIIKNREDRLESSRTMRFTIDQLLNIALFEIF